MKWRTFDEILQDAKGVPLGRVQTLRRPLTAQERKACSQFLETLSKNQKPKEPTMATSKTETKPTDKCNMVFLAGELKKLNVREDDGFCLVDSGPDNRFIPCTVYKEKELIAQLAAFAEGDIIQLRGYIRPWSKKVGNDWENHMEVRVTEIKNKPPRRPEPAKRTPQLDDDVPF